MFIANLIENKESKRSAKMGLFGLFSSKSRHTVKHPAHHRIMIEMNTVSIVNDEGIIDEQLEIGKSDRIALNDPYHATFEEVPTTYANLNGVDSSNTLLIEKDGDTRKYSFEIDSCNSINHLKNQILFWKSLGIKVEADGSVIHLN